MKLRQLFESKGSVGIIFGRFNPPHKGHRAAWEMASENGAWYVGTNKSTQGPKDPLPYDVKLKAMATIMPEIKGHVIPETSWLTLASKIYNKYGNVTLNVYTDEDWVTKTLIAYNGKEGTHGYYKFSSLNQIPTPRLSSATALRAAVQAGDRDAFADAAGVPADTEIAGRPFFDLVAHYLSAQTEKPKAKKKVKEPVAEGSSKKIGRGGTKPIDKEKKAAMKNASTLPGLNQSTGSAYKNYRMGIALAGAPTFPTKIEADNWIGGDPLLSAYTDEEFEMIKAAALQVGAGAIQNWSGNRSQEVADVNKVSPVAKPKRNKYGV